MSHARSIIGIPDLEIERVERHQRIEVWAKPKTRPRCHYCGGHHLTIKATDSRTMKHTRQGNQVMILHLRVPKYRCACCKRYFRHRFTAVTVRPTLTGWKCLRPMMAA